MAYKPQTVFQPTRTPMPVTQSYPAAAQATPQPGMVTNTQIQQAPAQVSTPTPPSTPQPTPGAAPSATPNPAGAGAPPGISARAWKSYNEINSTISPEQWQAWDQFADPTCPPDNPYRSQKNVVGGQSHQCAESPDNCPQGFRAYGQNDCRPEAEVARLAGETGPGGAGGGPPGAGGPGGTGGGGAGSTGIPGSGSFDPQDDFLWKALQDRLGQGSRWDPTTLATVLGQVKQGAEDQSTVQTDQYSQNLASRGLARSAVGNQGYRDIRANAGNQVLAARSQILKAKVDADYQDQTDTLSKMQDWINGRRNAILSSNQTEAQKRVALAQIQLGYAQLEQQLNMLREEYSQKLSLIGLQL